MDRSLADLDPVTLKSPRRVTVDLGLAKHTQDKMELPEQLVFAYQHNVIDVGMIDMVDGLLHHRVVGFDRIIGTVVHCSQKSAARYLGTLAGIVVVDTAPTMVVTPLVVVLCLPLGQDEG